MDNYFQQLAETFSKTTTLFERIFFDEFDGERFSFPIDRQVEDRQPCPKKRKRSRKTKSKTVEITRMIFPARLYSKIGSEMANGRGDEFAEKLLERIEDNPKSIQLHTICAISQLLADEANRVGSWMDTATAQPSQQRCRFHAELMSCCEAMVRVLLKDTNNMEAREVLGSFNAFHNTKLRLPELLLLQVFKKYFENSNNWIEVRMNSNIIRTLVLDFEDDRTIDEIFVPNVSIPEHNIWMACDKFFLDTDSAQSIGSLVRKAKSKLLIKLNDDEQTRREWLVNTFLLFNLFDLYTKNDERNPMVTTNTQHFEIVLAEGDLCVSYENKERDMCRFALVDDAVDFESINEPIFRFVGTTLGLYLRILYRINPNLVLSMKSKFFSVVADYSCRDARFLFSTKRPIESTNEKRRTETESTENINKWICEFLIRSYWIDTSSFVDKCYDVDQLFDVFRFQESFFNEEDFIQVAANFISKVYQLERVNKVGSEFVSYVKSIKMCEDEFEKVFANTTCI